MSKFFNFYENKYIILINFWGKWFCFKILILFGLGVKVLCIIYGEYIGLI